MNSTGIRPEWDEYFMVIAKIVSTRSTCNSRPTGAVVVRDKHILTTGYNGSMPGAPHCSDEPPVDGKPFCYRRHMNIGEYDKYNYCRSSHAEANAIAQAARFGISLDGATLYTTLAPCYVCLKLIAGARIRAVFFEYAYESSDPERDEFWKTAAREAKLETFKQLQVSNEAIAKVISSLAFPTSRRMLASTSPDTPYSQ